MFYAKTVYTLITAIFFVPALFFGCDDATSPRPITVGPNQIIVTAPAGGEVYHIGDSLRIRWLADTMIISNVVLSISLNKKRTWMELPLGATISYYDSWWGDFKWKIPDSLRQVSLLSDSAAIMVSDYAPGGTRTSSPLFAIKPQ
jgi:hypothetical protein